MPRNLRPRSDSPSTGADSSEFRLAWITPLVVAVLAALLEFAGKLPTWAQSPIVLSVALFCGALIVCAYIISRGLAKSEFRGDPRPGDPPPSEPF